MKSQVYIWIAIALAIIFGWFLIHRPQPQIGNQPVLTTNTTVTSSSIQAPTTNVVSNQPPVSIVNVDDSNSGDIQHKYVQGQIDKAQAMQELLLERNKRPQDLYGKIIDQFGQPVTKVEIIGTLTLNAETNGGIKTGTYTATSDADGLFQFTDIRGADFNVVVKKDGYKMGERGEGYKGPVGNITSPTDRAILTMWKIRGAEPLVNHSFEATIPYNGTSVIFDMATGKKTPDGDMQITLSRLPLQIAPGLLHPYDWQIKVAMLRGGLLPENDPYPYQAPENGYQQSFEFSMSSNSVPWKGELEQDFYIKSNQGQYGRLHIDILTSSKHSETGIAVQTTINPSGSQNLEPAFSP